MSDNRKHLETNRMLWDEYTRLHHDEKFYPVDEFLGGKDQLKEIEIEELGDVRGKELLHLQCHFGLDTLSWARHHGAKVTGVDFSPKAVETANELAQKLKLDARFFQANVLDLPDELHGKFDVVFTSYGVLTWLPELKSWGKQIARCLKPGGVFYIVEFHPASGMFDDESETPRLRYSYFREKEPLVFTNTNSYASPEGTMPPMDGVEWGYSLEEVFGALLDAGLTIEMFHEHQRSCFKRLRYLVQDSEGWWRFPETMEPMPLMFSLRARKSEV